MPSILEKAKKLPDAPGIYIFYGARKKILYIGKATSIRDRVKSYFNKDIVTSRGLLIEEMLAQAKNIDYIKTDSVLEALILESNTIKKHKPLFNTKEKDDKSFNYVIITDEDFPRVLLVRQREIDTKKFKEDVRYIFGPFPQGGNLKEALKIVRKIFPFRDRCTPNTGIHCFNRQIGLCPGICTGEVSQKEYQRTIRNIKFLFEGKKSALIKKLTAEMNTVARKQAFEQAGEIKKKIFALKHIQDVSLIAKPQISGEKTSIRIEGYDVAHLSGRQVVGVMVVVEDDRAQKDEYRKFNIKSEKKRSDTHALTEILERRVGHNEWPMPRIIVVDGGKAQVNTAGRVLKKYGIEIPVVGVVKDERHRPKKIIGRKDIISRHERDILLANSESHRFAIAFHRKKRKMR